MGYNDVIDRSGAEALIPEDAANEILQYAPEASAVMSLARRLPDMSRAQRRMPVLDSVLEAYFVGEKGRSPQTFDAVKQTAEADWADVFINAEEMAVIVPIPESVLEDSEFDIWGQIKPRINEAFGRKFDRAVLYGISNSDVPRAWPDGIFEGMPAANQIEMGSLGIDLYDDIYGEGGVLAKVEEAGYMVDGHIGALQLRAKMRGLRDENGQPIFTRDPAVKGAYELDGSPIKFPRNGAINPLKALLLSGDWQQLVWSVRKDISYKMLTEGVITDNASPRAIIHNLGQDDMVALRCTFRLGWALPNPVNPIQTNDAIRFPFSALVPAGSGS